jgi:hypothetical protein
VAGTDADIGEIVVDVGRTCTSSMVVVWELLTLVIQVIWPMMNVRLVAMAAEVGMMTI